MTIFKKLVRDNIPKIIEASGRRCSVELLEGDDLLRALKHKLREECDEFDEAENIEELADISEVVLAIAAALGIAQNQLEDERVAKRDKNGGFSIGVFLIEDDV